MRKSKTVTITAAGRDAGKNYLLTEMSVFQAEKWAARALLALGKGGADVSGATGMAGLSEFLGAGLSALAWADVEPLLDEMMGCVQFVTGSNVTRKLLPGVDDIEELSTMLTLRKEILGLHFDFFVPAEGSNSATEAP